MNEITIEELMANWKYQRTEQKEVMWEQYKKLPYSLDELEKMLEEKLPCGGGLSAYARVSKVLKHSIGEKSYAEIIRLYELCEGRRYFDISEVEEVLTMEYKHDCDEKRLLQICMDIIVRCPANVKVRDKLYTVQRLLFRLGEEDEVWYAYRHDLYPKELLKELYNKMKKEKCSKHRLAWILAWMSA